MAITSDYDRGMAVLLGAVNGVMPLPTTYDSARGFRVSEGAVPTAPRGGCVYASKIKSVKDAVDYAQAGWWGCQVLAADAAKKGDKTAQDGFLAASWAYRWVYDLGKWVTARGVPAKDADAIVANLRKAALLADAKVDDVRGGKVTPNADRRDPDPTPAPQPQVTPAVDQPKPGDGGSTYVAPPVDQPKPGDVVTGPVFKPVEASIVPTTMGTGTKLLLGAAVAGGIAYMATRKPKGKRGRK